MRSLFCLVLVALVGAATTGCHTYDYCTRDPVTGGRYRSVTYVGVTETTNGSEYYRPTEPARCPNAP